VTWYLVRRIGQSVVVIIGVLILTFILVHLEPGSTARAVLGHEATPARIALFNNTYGLNRPVLVQFWLYCKNVLHGNFGISYSSGQAVSTMIAQRLPRDVILLGGSTVLALIVGLPMGLYQAVHHGTVRDDLVAGTWFTLYSAPDFMEALLLIAVFSVYLHGFLQPNIPGGITSVGGLFADPNALVLPLVVLSINSVAGFSQYMRSSAIEELAQDYIRTARAKGLQQRLILTRHLLRNALLPIVTILGLSLPSIVSGAVIAEAIFNFPGMGLLFWQSALSHDYPVLLGATLIIGVATVAGNLAADVAYGILDPRIRHAVA
jgi:peptide/nickel transport system permease protein